MNIECACQARSLKCGLPRFKDTQSCLVSTAHAHSLALEGSRGRCVTSTAADWCTWCVVDEGSSECASFGVANPSSRPLRRAYQASSQARATTRRDGLSRKLGNVYKGVDQLHVCCTYKWQCHVRAHWILCSMGSKRALLVHPGTILVSLLAREPLTPHHHIVWFDAVAQ